MTWKVQVPHIVTAGSPRDYLVIFAGIEGATAGVKVTLSGMSLAYGKNFVGYSPSPVKAANSLTESINIYRDSGFGTSKKYDLSFLAKAGFRDDRLRTFPYIDSSIGFAIDYNLISAYAYRCIGEQNFNARYASRGVRARGYNADFTEAHIGLVLTDRVPDNDRNLYVKNISGIRTTSPYSREGFRGHQVSLHRSTFGLNFMMRLSKDNLIFLPDSTSPLCTNLRLKLWMTQTT